MVLLSSAKTYGQSEEKQELKKNAIHLDIYQRAFGFGLSYDRILYSKKIDLHCTVGFDPSIFIEVIEDHPIYSYNFSTYLTINKYKFKPIFGIGYNKKYKRFLDDYYENRNNFFAMIGLDYSLTKRFNVQFIYTPYYNVTTGNGYVNSMTQKYYEPSHSKGFTFVHGGLNLGYKF